MPHNRNAGRHNSFDRIHNFFSAFQFNSMCTGLFHDSDGTGQCNVRIGLIGAKREIHYHQTMMNASDDGLRMVNHLIQRYG